jgi:hypothetical protein
MQTCPNCQATTLENSTFCMACGGALGSAATPAVAAASTAGATTLLPAAAPTVQPALRTSSRTIAIAGLLLCLLFFSPFVSCGNQTYSGAQAFQASLPQSKYDQAKDGLVLILLPLAGVVGLIVGLIAIQRVDSGSALGALRALGIVAILAALVTACPISAVLIDTSRSNGVWKIEWGFWASSLAAIAMFVGAMGLMKGPGVKVS